MSSFNSTFLNFSSYNIVFVYLLELGMKRFTVSLISCTNAMILDHFKAVPIEALTITCIYMKFNNQAYIAVPINNKELE